jgi:hypothetical protein
MLCPQEKQVTAENLKSPSPENGWVGGAGHEIIGITALQDLHRADRGSLATNVVFLPRWLFFPRIRDRVSTWTCQVFPDPLLGLSLEFFGGGITFPYCDYF